ncbi:dihydrofolate reductase [Nocardia cyriacigeorgica]|uniref:Dihydrofolate reductase n=1 Tax=Nocardia cyriacigeorgica TaxID=135487 RepID=A0A6P1DC95_9NOCA|nr:dihydrofolate reductase family protein [Nocardia cyriacigeorgica]NEW42700.1 dihydrofolate reductase [Nocardia cyriacigeorgica]NEW47818.1 dihydrofolate reductase [Nocardia cyriacigeorgica]NEW53892.1 dihydrofolate reductase [Nocardia cyriacigeorgica]NEW58933.1 dihydrofolate reductase [Nocardia cyriacigeorgica]
MRKLVYYVGMTLDGYIAGPDGGIEFFPLAPDFKEWIAADYPETLPTHAQPHFGVAAGTPNKNFDTLVMGRGTYDPGLAVGITSPYGHMRQYVVSTTIGQIEDPGVELVESDPVGLVRRLKQEDGMDIWLAGGGKLAGALLDEIDELVIKSYPVSAGDGIRAFDGPFRPTLFTPSKRREFSNGTQVTWLTRS